MPKELPNWQTIYDEQSSETMPWYTPVLDRDLENALRELSIFSGHILDLGTGPATQAIELSIKGFKVTASDISAGAIKRGKEKAKKKSAKVTFSQDDILASKLKGPFDYIFDRGCFHVFDEEKRKLYLTAVHKMLAPKGRLFLKCFSTQEPGDHGPYRFQASDIQTIFQNLFTVESIKETVYQGTLNPVPKALFCVLKKN